jgi:hypothetical protein
MSELPRAPRNWPIRRHPRIAHLMPYMWSDSLRSVRVAKRLGFRFTDKNGQVDADRVTWIVHWAVIGKNRGLTWIATDHRDARGREVRRRLTKAELASRIKDHPTEWVARLRTREHGGRRLYTAREMMAEHARLDMTMCLEGKATMKGARAFQLLAGDAIATGVRIVFMRLQDIPGWRKAFRRALAVGLVCALLPRGPRPADWASWKARGVQRWGSWR